MLELHEVVALGPLEKMLAHGQSFVAIPGLKTKGFDEGGGFFSKAPPLFGEGKEF